MIFIPAVTVYNGKVYLLVDKQAKDIPEDALFMDAWTDYSPNSRYLRGAMNRRPYIWRKLKGDYCIKDGMVVRMPGWSINFARHRESILGNMIHSMLVPV